MKAGAKRRDAATPRRTPWRVLIVDDFEDGLDMYAQYFAYAGWAVETAGDGVQALATATLHKPDVVVMDLGLPQMDGFEATRRMRASSSLKNVPIVALSGFVHNDAVETALAAGCDLFLPRPMAPQQLAETLEQLLTAGAGRRVSRRGSHHPRSAGPPRA